MVSKLREWRDQGEKLILLFDSNGNMENGPLAKILAHLDLHIIDAIKQIFNLPGLYIFVRCSCQIDKAWVTLGIDIDCSFFLPFFFYVRDHRAIILDILQQYYWEGHKISITAVHCLNYNKQKFKKQNKQIR